MRELDEIQSLIGYGFNDERVLRSAFTHSSFVNEHEAVGNERIEFLGDCVLNFIVGEKLYFDDPTASEGKLSARRSALVSRAPLARIVDELDLVDALRVGAGVDKSAFSVKARSDLFEALLGAVYVDGGMQACKGVLDKIFFGKVTPERDYKSELQERAVKLGVSVKYDTKQGKSGFTCTVSVGNRRYSGGARTKHGAQIAAARAALSDIDEKK